MSLLRVDKLTKAFGGVKAIDDLSFEIRPGAIHSVIGPNGAGKTTLFNMITGVYVPTSGAITFDGVDIAGRPPHRLARLGISRTFQNLQIFFNMTALENVLVGRHTHLRRNFIECLLHYTPWLRRSEQDARHRARALLDHVGLADHADTLASAMPYGALKRLEIARALATAPRMILLDEPAAGLNNRETRDIDALIQQVAQDGVTVVLVEHDMHLVMNVSDHIIVLDHGRKLAEGTAEEVRNNPAVIEAYLGTEAEGRDAADH